MSEWIDVDADSINREVPREIQGVKVKVSFSPYDVPRQFRTYREENSKFFVVEFRYLVEEATRSEIPSENSAIELEVGVDSQRIYKIKLNTEKFHFDSDTIAQDVVEAIKQFSETVPARFQSRYRMPEEIVSQERSQLFSELER